ncbi:MAG: response regulator, partial [bacterium]
MGEEKPLTTGDVARYCHVTHVGVLKWIKGGKLKAYSTPGGHYRILRNDFRDFLKQYNMPIDESFFSDHTKKILVVDDEPDIVELIIRVLKSDNSNYVFASASDGYEAGLQVAAFKPDLVVLDIMMPKLDGFEVCRQIKSNPETQHIKILGITGFAEDGNIDKMLACGADHCLAKPLQIEELKARVRGLVGFSRRKEDALSA